jgi:hypothetical protein
MEERKLTEELREKMLGNLPFSVNATKWITPEKFKDIEEEFRPSFEVKAFNKTEATQAKKYFSDIKNAKEDAVIDLLRKKVVNWKNVFDVGTGLEIIYKADDTNGGCDKELFSSLPSIIIGDILWQVTKISGLLDTDKLGLKV